MASADEFADSFQCLQAVRPLAEQLKVVPIDVGLWLRY
jgi:hypothetical protein